MNNIKNFSIFVNEKINTMDIKLIYKKTEIGCNAYLGEIKIGNYFYRKYSEKDKYYTVNFLLNLPRQPQTEHFDTIEECRIWLLEKTNEFIKLLKLI